MKGERQDVAEVSEYDASEAVTSMIYRSCGRMWTSGTTEMKVSGWCVCVCVLCETCRERHQKRFHLRGPTCESRQGQRKQASNQASTLAAAACSLRTCKSALCLSAVTIVPPTRSLALRGHCARTLRSPSSSSAEDRNSRCSHPPSSLNRHHRSRTHNGRFHRTHHRSKLMTAHNGVDNDAACLSFVLVLSKPKQDQIGVFCSRISVEREYTKLLALKFSSNHCQSDFKMGATRAS